MLLLVIGDLIEDFLFGRGEVGDSCTAGDGAGAGADVRGGEAGAGCGTKVEFGFEVFEIESEVEDVGVGNAGVGGDRGCGAGHGAGAATARDKRGCGGSSRGCEEATAGECFLGENFELVHRDTSCRRK